MGQQVGITGPQFVGLFADLRLRMRRRPRFQRVGLKAAANARSGSGPGRKDRTFQNRFVLAPKRRHQARIDERRLAAPRSAHHHHKPMVADLPHQLANRARRIVRRPAAEEKRRVLFAECIKPTVRADVQSCGFGAHQACLNGRQKALELVRRIQNLRDMREIDPGDDPEKIERRIARVRQQHRYDREGRIAGLPNKR